MCSKQELGTRKVHRACAEISWYLWLDGRMDDHMTTCTQRATSHKCSILFSNNTLRPVSSHFGLLGSGWRPTEAFMSLLRSSFGACRGHQGWGQFTVSPVPWTEACISFYFLLVWNHDHLVFLTKGFFNHKDLNRFVQQVGIIVCLLRSQTDWHGVNCPPPWQGVNEDGFGWLVRAGDVFCLEKSILHL